MSISKKLLILLLMLSIIPLMCISAFSIRSMNNMGRRIIKHSGNRMIEREKSHLREKIIDTVSILENDIRLITMAIDDQVKAVENVLAETRGAEAAGEKPLPLSGLDDGYRMISKLSSSQITWQHTCLESGQIHSLPDPGRYPPDYDPRRSPWYAAAIKSEGPVVSKPYENTITGVLVNTIAETVRWPDGTVAGVTAIDFSIPVTLHSDPAGQSEWLKQTAVMIVELTAPDRFQIIAHQVYSNKALTWDTPDETLHIDIPPGIDISDIMKTANAAGVFFHQSTYKEKPYIWALTGLREYNMFMLSGVPLKYVLAGAMESEDYLRSSFIMQTGIMAAMMLFTALIVCAISFRTSKNVTRPVAELTETAKRISEGDLESRVSFSRDDELGSLGNSVNEMAGSIERLINEQEAAHLQMLKSLSNALEAKDNYTAVHSRRVAAYALRLGKRIGLDDETMDLLKRGALVHDLGKIGIPDKILNKNGPLNSEEAMIMRNHPVETAAIMKPLVRFKSFAQIAAWHHENWDGSGYPDGLAGDDIPLLARIVAIADTWDAMTGDRIYRKGMSQEKAVSILESEVDSGQFDPELLTVFIRMIRSSLIREDKSDT